MQYRIDQEGRFLHLDLRDVATAQKALEPSLVLLADRPDLWGWDWIVESPIVPEYASVEQIALLARIYGAQPRAAATSALVSQDANLHLWARVMDFQFPGRKHVVVHTREAAMRLIGRTRVGRT